MDDPDFKVAQSPQPEQPPTPSTPASEPVEQPPEPTPTPEPSEQSPETSGVQIGPQKKKMSKLLTILIVVVVLAILGALAYIKFKPAHKSTPSVSQSTKKDIPLIRYGEIAGPYTPLYPHTGTSVDTYTANEQAFEGLVGYHNKQLVPLLATKWTNPDASTWIFDLKPDVKFHTGRTMTAADVKYSLDNFKDTDFGQLYNTTIKSVEAVNDHQVKITTDGPDALLLNRLVFLYIIDSKSTTPDSAINGTGPYTVKPGTTPSETSLDLVAFDDYHGGHVYTREIQFQVYDSDDKMAEAVKQKQVDIGAFIDATAADKLKATGYTDLYVDDPTVYAVVMNTKKAGPLQNLKVRQAIYYALDPQAYLKSQGVPGKPASQIVVSGIPGYNQAITRPERDINKAKQLLTDAGYPKGLTIPFEYLTPQLDSIAGELKSELAPAGITLKLNPVALKVAHDDRVAGKFDLSYRGYSSDLLDLTDVVVNNFQTSYYDNPTVDKQIIEANKTFDPATRLQILQQISKTLMDDVGWAPTVTTIAPYISAHADYVMPLEIPSTSYPGIFFWEVYQK